MAASGGGLRATARETFVDAGGFAVMTEGEWSTSISPNLIGRWWCPRPDSNQHVLTHNRF
jgi:hypothetical protein